MLAVRVLHVGRRRFARYCLFWFAWHWFLGAASPTRAVALGLCSCHEERLQYLPPRLIRFGSDQAVQVNGKRHDEQAVFAYFHVFTCAHATRYDWTAAMTGCPSSFLQSLAYCSSLPSLPTSPPPCPQYYSEYMVLGSTFLFREGRAKGIGKIRRVIN